MVLFFPGISFFAADPAAVIIFSAFQELIRILTYIIPALGLLWYLILEKKSLSLHSGEFRAGKKDFYVLFWGFPGLILTGAGVSLLMTQFSATGVPPAVAGPSNIQGWIIVILSCAGTGYLEESFFRFYLLQKLRDWVPYRPAKMLFAVLLFTLCHAYEGPWGMLNAALAGLLLSILFEKYKTLHGIAWAHAFYNVFIYVYGSIGG